MTHTEQTLSILREARTAPERTRNEERRAIEKALEKLRDAQKELYEVLRGSLDDNHL